MRGLLLLLLAPLLVACELGQRLDIQDMGESPGYFLECYCQPGEMYKMTATEIAPIADAQLLDYSLEFDIHIRAEERIELYHSLFTNPGSKFVYNYASSRIFESASCDTLYLEALTPKGTRITARTAIPDEIEIDTVFRQDRQLHTVFYASRQPEQNYFILHYAFMKEGRMVRREVYNLDYGDLSEEQRVEHTIKNTVISESDSVIVTLKRVTRENLLYQNSLLEAGNANEDNITFPVPLNGNLHGALGIFTCYTNDRYCWKKQ